MVTLLELQDLKTYFYSGQEVVKAVNGLSLKVERGETIGVVGESGSGKSVTAFSILRLVNHPGRIISGRVFFEGVDLMKISDREMRSIRGNRIAMIFQEPMTSLNPVLTIERQLSEAIEAHKNVGRDVARKRSIELLEKVGIPDPVKRMNDFPHLLSGGMRQRVMIAMALSCNPDLIIADEPTTAVDVTLQAQLLDLMKNLTQESGTTLMIISHNLGLMARYADRIAIMYAGKIVEVGNVFDIFKKPQHPYTLGLLSSIPRLDQPRADTLNSIMGQPPDLARLPNGCSFKERCNYAVGRCGVDEPELMKVNNDHWSACWEISSLNHSKRG